MDLKTPPVKRSVTLHGHRTSITLEKPFWEELQKIAEAQSKSVNKIIAEIDEKAGRNVAEALCNTGSSAWAYTTDVRNAGSIEVLVRETLDRFGRIDILLCCTSEGKYTPPNNCMFHI